MQETTITLLVENHSAIPKMKSEHGLSLWIETQGLKILFDTGASGMILNNAKVLGIALEEADYVILSHGHYDHTGGLESVLGINQKASIVLHPDTLLSRYSCHSGKPVKSIGMPETLKLKLQSFPQERIIWSSGPVSLSEDVHVTGPISRLTSYEDVGGPFFLDAQGTQPDLLPDDQALWIRTSEGLIVCGGCAHSGIVNILRQSLQQSGEKSLLAVMGGFHLVHASPQRMVSTLEALQTFSPSGLFPCHCTGLPAVESLRLTFREKLIPVRGGMVLRC